MWCISYSAVLEVFAIVGKQFVCPFFSFSICDYPLRGSLVACLSFRLEIIVDKDIEIGGKPFGTLNGRQSELFPRELDNVPVFSAAETIEMVVVQLQTACFFVVERAEGGVLPYVQPVIFGGCIDIHSRLYFFKNVHLIIS